MRMDSCVGTSNAPYGDPLYAAFVRTKRRALRNILSTCRSSKKVKFRRTTTLWWVSKKSAENPGYSEEASNPSYLSHTVEVHSHTPPLCPLPSPCPPVVALHIRRYMSRSNRIFFKAPIALTVRDASYGTRRSALPRNLCQICRRRAEVQTLLASVRCERPRIAIDYCNQQ